MRRLPFTFTLTFLLTSAFASAPAATSPEIAEHQWQADRGDGTFQNPVLSGHWHDPTVVRVGADYYMTHCEHDSRGPIVWHSRDLVNWRPLARIESLAGLGNMWATDLIHHDGLFYFYVPLMLPADAEGRLSFNNYVVTAKDPAGPWSAPVKLDFPGIDPGHVVDRDGSRYIYVNAGRVIKLAPDGLRTAGAMQTVYAGWPIPEEWVIECHCLESPKLFWRGDWCYMVSAQGGTAGPTTSHMVVVARARSALGPWENAPISPMLRTKSRSDRWWSQGHGTLVEATDGSWWMLYHAIQNGRRSLGRNTLLLPVTWTDDGWPVIPDSVKPDAILPKPPGENVGHGMMLSDDFRGPTVGIQWDSPSPVPVAEFNARFRTGDGRLRMTASGHSPRDATRLWQLPTNVSYEVQVAIEAPVGVEAGLLLSGSETSFTGLGLRDGKMFHHRRGTPEAKGNFAGRTVWFKIRNVDHDVTFFTSTDGATWTKFNWGANVSSEQTQRIVLYAAGTAEAVFRHFVYQALP